MKPIRVILLEAATANFADEYQSRRAASVVVLNLEDPLASQLREAKVGETPLIFIAGPAGAARLEGSDIDGFNAIGFVGVGATPPPSLSPPALLMVDFATDPRSHQAILSAAESTDRSTTITWNSEAQEKRTPRALVLDIETYISEISASPTALEDQRFISGTRKTATLADGATLSYTEYGSGDRVIFTAQMAFPPAPNYASELARIEGTRVLEVVLRGYRPSSLVHEDRGLGWLNQWADDIAELASMLKIDKFIYTGGSHGGGVGWYLARRHPERVSLYIGVVSGPHDREDNTESSVIRRQINSAWPDTERIRDLMERGVFGALRHPERRSRRDKLIDESVAGYGAMVPEEARINQGKPWPEAVTDVALEEELRAVTVPSLLLSGAQDVIISSRASFRAAACVPDAKMVFWQDEGHMTWEEEPRRLVTRIRDHIEARGL